MSALDIFQIVFISAVVIAGLGMMIYVVKNESKTKR